MIILWYSHINSHRRRGEDLKQYLSKCISWSEAALVLLSKWWEVHSTTASVQGSKKQEPKLKLSNSYYPFQLPC